MDAGDAGRRASQRSRKMASRVVEVMVDDATRKRAASARLESLERDNVAGVTFDEDDEDFQVLDEMEQLTGDGRKGAHLGRRKTRQAKAASAAKAQTASKGPQTFADILDAARLEALPPGTPSYLTAAMGPPQHTAPRQFCSVCGRAAPYTCVRCGARFCCISCQNLHRDTRCLKFVT